MVITLIGYRGSGKSTIAPLLAERLGWEWIDADAEIERRAGRTIREIFASQGEPTFRDLERETIGELLGRERLVLAAGGGAVLDASTRQRMRHAGPVVWCDAPVETLYERILADATTAERRPNLTGRGGIDEVRELLGRREPLYRETACVVIDTQRLDPANAVDEILLAVGERAGARP
ncbi:MAG TPA: shikimate kinase [Planctomycetaceae bacterium]|nr:shikimate kinase [Planctomycetaceae bacterium]